MDRAVKTIAAVQGDVERRRAGHISCARDPLAIVGAHSRRAGRKSWPRQSGLRRRIFAEHRERSPLFDVSGPGARFNSLPDRSGGRAPRGRSGPAGNRRRLRSRIAEQVRKARGRAPGTDVRVCGGGGSPGARADPSLAAPRSRWSTVTAAASSLPWKRAHPASECSPMRSRLGSNKKLTDRSYDETPPSASPRNALYEVRPARSVVE